MSSLQAFNGNRKGFILGLGAGVQTVDLETGKNPSYGGLATAFKVGGGITDQFLLFYSNDVAWFDNGYDNYYTGVTGLGFQYYFQKENSLYLSGSLGFASLSDADRTFQYLGTGGTLGLGYEFKKHVSVEGKLMMSSVEHEDDSSYKLDPVSMMMTVNYMFY